MANYLIEGTVTAWPEGATFIEINPVIEDGVSQSFANVDMETGVYSIPLNAIAGSSCWLTFTCGVWGDMGMSILAVKTFGPFIIDEVGVLNEGGGTPGGGEL